MASTNDLQTELLKNDNLKNAINKMIKLKHLPAICESITVIADRDGEEKIIIGLQIESTQTGKKADVHLYIGSQLFKLDYFNEIDKKLGVDLNNIDINKLVMLRALRFVFNIIIDNNIKSSIDLGNNDICIKNLNNGQWYYSSLLHKR